MDVSKPFLGPRSVSLFPSAIFVFFYVNCWCSDYCHSFITAGCATNGPPGTLTTTLTLRRRGGDSEAHGWLASCILHTISHRPTLLSHGRQAGDIKRADAGVVCLVCWHGGYFSSRHLLAPGWLLEMHLGFFWRQMAKRRALPRGGTSWPLFTKRMGNKVATVYWHMKQSSP